ncbi:16S rRNA (adenine(1518)-N(6)/adenine(1519)-N(6)) -dimethyltransferase RsmA [Pyruvatibacter sp. HU-CL02332]|uniref:16S rRNA (adenine(1518)-N(6)/adenine(1519)-N(6))- dimethyltransferase RsmA n=1 Tax=Pyruvatibacter sp. HU-CL02332 TaxID=3127650 RepID=UPI0031099AAB
MSDDGLPPLRDVIAEHGLDARKSLGQHFLLDLNLTRRIARVAGDLGEHDTIEVGPGPGGLTRALLMEGAKRVVAVERDERASAALAEVGRTYAGRFSLVEADAMAVDEADHITGPARIVANLPYNISTALLLKWLSLDPWPSWLVSMTLMFQKEVAERVVAAPGSKAYGRLSVISQWRTDAYIAFDVDPRAFTPPPKVMSSIVHMTPKAMGPDDPPLHAVEKVTAAAFGQRRKMLRASLKQVFQDPEAICEQVGIKPTERAERLTVDNFLDLARLL